MKRLVAPHKNHLQKMIDFQILTMDLLPKYVAVIY